MGHSGSGFYRTVLMVKIVLKLLHKSCVKVSTIVGGAGGIRTPYLCDANATFSRVNYGPVCIPL
jgi:hypothetical protein